MLVTFTFKKASILATIIIMTALVICISVSVTRFFDRNLYIKQNNLNVAKISTSSKGPNADNKTDVENSKKKQEIDGDTKKNDNKNSIVNKNVEVVKSGIKKDLQSDGGDNISKNNEKQVLNQVNIVTNKNRQNIVATGKDKIIDVKLQKTEEDIKQATIANTRNGYTDDKVVTKNDIIVNIHIVKEKKDKNKKTNKVARTLKKVSNQNGNRKKQVIKTRDGKKKQTIKKNEVKLKQTIIKNGNDDKKNEEKKSTDTNNIISPENKNDKITPKVIQEVEKPNRQNEYEESKENEIDNPQLGNTDEDEMAEVYNTIIVGDE